MAGCSCYPVEKNGVEYNHFIAETFGECLYSVREIASFMIGMSSLLFWFCCQTPQFIKNYTRKSGNALSKWFLIEWFMGDALNLLGCVLTQQLVTQLATSVLFICVDVAMITQILYYSCFYNHEKEERKKSISETQKGRGQGRERTDTTGSRFSAIDVERIESDTSFIDDYEYHSDSDTDTDTNNYNGGMSMNGRAVTSLAAAMLPISVVLWTTTIQSESPSQSQSRMLESYSSYVFSYVANAGDIGIDNDLPNCEADPHSSKGVESTGVALGWISAVVYLNSRLPQLLKNYKRQSVDGLSWVMFFCAVMGNLTYGLGVLLRDSSPKAVLKALPWLTGSLGTLFLDFFILLQFYLYPSIPDERSSEAYEYVRLDDAHNYSNTVYDIRRESPARGLFGIKSWTTSPLFKPRSFYQVSNRRSVPRDNFSHGVLPSETSVPSLSLPPNAAFSSIAQHMEEETREDQLRGSGIPRADSF
mmetsp:Transcript_34878/g.43073  ORF Transcript_34878/g.43073 Transcript_34878/m.43073 type:complete len:475 (+) Transcript_34878:168-1592(+)